MIFDAIRSRLAYANIFDSDGNPAQWEYGASEVNADNIDVFVFTADTSIYNQTRPGGSDIRSAAVTASGTFQYNDDAFAAASALSRAFSAWSGVIQHQVGIVDSRVEFTTVAPFVADDGQTLAYRASLAATVVFTE